MPVDLRKGRGVCYLYHHLNEICNKTTAMIGHMRKRLLYNRVKTVSVC